MIIEPHEAYTVKTPAIRMDKAKTREEYIADLYAIHGRPPEGMPLYLWLAGIESPGKHKFGYTPITDDMRAKISAAMLEVGRKRMVELLTHLAQPMTIDQMIAATGWSKTTVRRALNRAKAEGRVTTRDRKPPHTWTLEAAQ